MSTRFWLASLLSLTLAACPGPDPQPPQGRQWQLLASELPEALLSISGRSSTDVWAVGADQGSGPLVLHFDGASWKRIVTGTRGSLWWVHVLADGEVWAAGENATVLRGNAEGFTRVPTPGLARQTIFGLWASSASDVWAVGSAASRNGFIWRYDGSEWREVKPAVELPSLDHGDAPGLFKVWGNESGARWIAGGKGVLLHAPDGETFSLVETGTTDTIFTVHGSGSQLAAVGGAGRGFIAEAGGKGLVDASPSAIPLLQGVHLSGGGRGWASGQGGTILTRSAFGGAWLRMDHPLEVKVESLHAIWADPEGGVWAVGGNVLSSALDSGALVHYGRDALPPYAPLPEVTPAATCPEAQVDPAADKSIARRWNEQLLGAIRRDIPQPGVHARNLFHVSAAMFDAWAAFDASADGVFFREKHSAADVARAREEAISYAAFRVLKHRYSHPIAAGADVSQACFDAFMSRLGFEPGARDATGSTPRAIGNRVAQTVIEAAAHDGANETGNYADTTGFEFVNAPLVVDLPGAELKEPSKWQAMVLAQAVTQNGIPVGAGAQAYIGAHWGLVEPFALSRPSAEALYYDPGPVPVFGTEMRGWIIDVVRSSSELDPASGETVDLSPGATGNNALGANDGVGHPLNPITGQPYAPHVVAMGDFARVLSEYWADGPKSETPPGHWNVIAHHVSDHPDFPRQLGGVGEPLEPLEWDVKLYLALNGGVHDAAIAAWEVKRRFACARPISLIRYMGEKGQSSDPALPSFHSEGLPLVDGLIELITPGSASAGGRHEHLARYIGQVAIRSWRGEPGDRRTQVGGVGWIRAVEWMPYQLRTFVTPAFPGFISGHSTFSRASAEVLTRLTGSAFFPGGLGEFVARPNAYLTFEAGPSTEVHLQWGTYYDAADQSGQSRIYGGIHILPDDFAGRRIGAEVGADAAELALTHFDGSAVP